MIFLGYLVPISGTDHVEIHHDFEVLKVTRVPFPEKMANTLAMIILTSARLECGCLADLTPSARVLRSAAARRGSA